MGNALSATALFRPTEPSYDEGLADLVFIPELMGIDIEKYTEDPFFEILNGNENLRELKGRRFPALFLRPKGKSKHVLMYFHSNSCDLGQIAEELGYLRDHLGCYILAIEYVGFGLCYFEGAANQFNINRRALAAYHFLRSLDVDSRNVLVFGRSIGTGAATKLARNLYEQKQEVGGVILHAPYISVEKLVEEYMSYSSYLIENIYDNYENLLPLGSNKETDTPLLIVHGKEDEIIPVTHSEFLMNNLRMKHKHASYPYDSFHNQYYVIDDLGIPINTFLQTLSRSRHCRDLDLSVPATYLAKGVTQTKRVELPSVNKREETGTRSSRDESSTRSSRAALPIVHNCSITSTAVRPKAEKPVAARPKEEKPVAGRPKDDKLTPVRPKDDKPTPVRHTVDKLTPVRHTVDKLTPVRPKDDKPTPVRPKDEARKKSTADNLFLSAKADELHSKDTVRTQSSDRKSHSNVGRRDNPTEEKKETRGTSGSASLSTQVNHKKYSSVSTEQSKNGKHDRKSKSNDDHRRSPKDSSGHTGAESGRVEDPKKREKKERKDVAKLDRHRNGETAATGGKREEGKVKEATKEATKETMKVPTKEALKTPTKGPTTDKSSHKQVDTRKNSVSNVAERTAEPLEPTEPIEPTEPTEPEKNKCVSIAVPSSVQTKPEPVSDAKVPVSGNKTQSTHVVIEDLAKIEIHTVMFGQQNSEHTNLNQSIEHTNESIDAEPNNKTYVSEGDQYEKETEKEIKQKDESINEDTENDEEDGSDEWEPYDIKDFTYYVSNNIINKEKIRDFMENVLDHMN